jgi:hypothetical protein
MKTPKGYPRSKNLQFPEPEAEVDVSKVKPSSLLGAIFNEMHNMAKTDPTIVRDTAKVQLGMVKLVTEDARRQQRKARKK